MKHYPVLEKYSGCAIINVTVSFITEPDDYLQTWCKNVAEKFNHPSEVHQRHRRQTDGIAVTIAGRNVSNVRLNINFKKSNTIGHLFPTAGTSATR